VSDVLSTYKGKLREKERNYKGRLRERGRETTYKGKLRERERETERKTPCTLPSTNEGAIRG